MKQIRCEVCGSTDLIKQDGLFVCQSCGIQYSLEEVKKLMVEGTVKIDKTDEIENLLKRAFMLLEEAKWDEADKLLEEILNKDPENAQAYVGKLMIQLKVKTQDKIGDIPLSFEGNIHYERIIRFGDNNLKNTFLGYSQRKNLIANVDEIASNEKDLKKDQKNIVIVEPIHEKAFLCCCNIENVYIFDGITEIPAHAFSSCEKLKNIVIPNSVEYIGWCAFSNCVSLTNIKIPNAVTKIISDTFNNCTSLASIEISDSVIEIGNHTFSRCTSLTNIKMPNTVKSIGEGAFAGCTSLTSIEIPNSVTSIGKYAFSNCTALAKVKIGNSLNKIDEHTFGDCTSLQSVQFGNNVSYIRMWAFQNCKSLKNITIPSSVKYIDNHVFNGCTALVNIQFGKTPENLPFILPEHLRQKRWRELGVCQNCGGRFEGFFTKKCSNCGQEKNY